MCECYERFLCAQCNVYYITRNPFKFRFTGCFWPTLWTTWWPQKKKKKIFFSIIYLTIISSLIFKFVNDNSNVDIFPAAFDRNRMVELLPIKMVTNPQWWLKTYTHSFTITLITLAKYKIIKGRLKLFSIILQMYSYNEYLVLCLFILNINKKQKLF